MEANDAPVRRMSPSSALPFLAWAALLVVQLVSPDKAWSWLLVGLGALILIGYGWARVMRDRVSAERRTLGAWVVAGDELREEFTLTNASALPVLWAHVRDRSDVPGYSVARVETVGGLAERTWTMAGLCQRRGVFRLGPWDLEMSDPLGFFRVTHHYPQTTTIMVYPRAAFLPGLELPRGHAPGRSISPERSVEETIQVGGVRQYIAGDPLRRVHWPATAHHGAIMVREFDREPSGDLWLIVDLDAAVQAGAGAEATQEYAVILAASLAVQHLRQGERRAVGLLLAGRSPLMLPPSREPAQLWRILQALAEVEPQAGTSLAELLRQAGPTLGSGRTLAIITPSQDGAWVAPLLPLMSRGNAPTVILLDATTFDPPAGAAERLDGLRGLLGQQRIPHTVIAKGFPFRPLERIKRQRIELRALSGSGRVIPVRVEEEV
ncbi:MAG: hypothetical protein BWY52_02545 [Chloroflexi bacterium ADurb.Bin325]|nr:MAG: hypothetical protein BWY52_02545 [Chloroflexi bacterium ADurb.Bin325]